MTKRVRAAAIKTPRGVVTKRPPAHHVDVAKKARRTVGTDKGERGFVTAPGGKFVGRQEGKKVARKAGQVRVKGRRGLHSEDLYGK